MLNERVSAAKEAGVKPLESKRIDSRDNDRNAIDASAFAKAG
ncbi:hypothetical protein [Sphingopyxis kveilinensis]